MKRSLAVVPLCQGGLREKRRRRRSLLLNAIVGPTTGLDIGFMLRRQPQRQRISMATTPTDSPLLQRWMRPLTWVPPDDDDARRACETAFAYAVR